ncbi:MAG: hypothetical protein NC127_03350 [Muribaculum sp.]|nr:hypothetical protein [Muribaculum sp.]
MKSLIYLLTALTAISATAENKTMFIHYGGENVDAIFFSEIDSIRYSDIGIDSTALGKIRIQEIWTPDSVYRYDIAEIDSVTFQSPATIAKPGAIDLSRELSTYVTGDDYTDGITLRLAGNTPSSLLPKTGNYLYQLEPSDVLAAGFAGHVLTVESDNGGWAVKCESAEFDEIFDQLAWVGENEFIAGEGEVETDPESEEQSSPSRAIQRVLALPTLASRLKCPDLISGALIMTDELKDIPAGPKQAQIVGKIAVTPVVSCLSGAYIIRNARGDIKKGRRMKSNARVKVKGYAEGRYNIGDKRTIGASRTPLKFTLPMGLGQTYILSYLGTMTLEGKMGLDYAFESEYRSTATTVVNYDNTAGIPEATMEYTHKVLNPETRTLDASFEGSLSLTGSLTFTITQSGDSLKSISNIFSYGSSLKGDALFLTSQIEDAKENNTLYRTITSTGVKATSIESITASIKYSGWTLKLKGAITPSASETFYVVPKFSSPAWDKTTKSMTYAVEGSPMKFSSASLGTAVKSDDDGTFSWMASGKTWPSECRTAFVGQADYDPTSEDKVYPTVTLPSGERILAAPEYPIVSNGLFPTISVQESQGVRVTSGTPIIGSAADGTTSVHIGNLFPYNSEDKK